MAEIGFMKAYKIAWFLKMEGFATFRVDRVENRYISNGEEITITLTDKGEKEFSDIKEAVEWAENELRGEKEMKVQHSELTDYLDSKV